MSVEYITSGSVTKGVRYIISSVTEYDAGEYSCTATNNFGSDTRHLTLTVNIGSGGGGSGDGESNWEPIIAFYQDSEIWSSLLAFITSSSK